MKIVFVLPGDGISGGVRVTITIGNRLIERGHEVRLLIRRKKIGMRSLMRIAVEKIYYRPHKWTNDFIGAIEKFEKISDCYFDKEEIIIGVGMWASYQIGILSKVNNKKIQYIHGATPWDRDLMEKTLKMNLPKILVATYLKEISEAFSRGTVLDIIPNGFENKIYYPCFNEMERDGVGTIYSSHPSKDPETIIGTLNNIRISHPFCPIRVFGTDKRPPGLSFGEYVRYPSLTEAREIYSRSLVWIVASMSEGFPAPVLEAMGCGAVVVATDCGGTRDIIQDGRNGFLVPVGDKDKIAERVALVLRNEMIRRKIRGEAEKELKKYSWENTVNKIENAIKRISLSP